MKITIRKYEATDGETVARLFYETVHTVNAADYTREQLFAWANAPDGLLVRRADLLRQKTLLALADGTVVGFGSIDPSGYLDLLFVHKAYLRQGIATALCDELENGCKTVTTHASVTALPFFRQRGYAVIRAQEVKRRGVTLCNFVMQKDVTK